MNVWLNIIWKLVNFNFKDSTMLVYINYKKYREIIESSILYIIYNTLKLWNGYDIKQSDGEAPTLEIWGMWSTPSLSLLWGPLCG